MPCRTETIRSRKDIDAILSWLTARDSHDAKVEAAVVDILAAVRLRGDDAILEYTRAFDCPGFDQSWLKVPQSSLDEAYARVPDEDRRIIAEAAGNIRSFHEAQVQQSWWRHAPDGSVLGQIVRPVDRAGLYVPGGAGGETPLISSLLMTAIPAQVAGVAEIAVVSPPRKDGTLNPYILAAARLLGVTEVYACGSAWAIGALALGTQTLRAVDVIAGPGNLYVTTAKRLVAGRVGIDMLAGPSEILILADESANPRWLAADMLSQAEHDPLASALLVTPSVTLGKEVLDEISKQLAALPRSEIASAALNKYGAVLLVETMDMGLELVNAVAPEHLELAVTDPWALLGKVRHAGAIFLGNHCPEPVGDYFAGPNHVLPTMGTARFASALSVDTFVKKTSVVATSCDYVNRQSSKIARLARLEGLEAHARSAEMRTLDAGQLPASKS